MASSAFVQHFTRSIVVSRPVSPSPSPSIPGTPSDDPGSPVLASAPIAPSYSPRKPALHALLVHLNHRNGLCASEVAHAVKHLKEILLGHHDDPSIAVTVPRSLQVVADPEEEAMKQEILKFLTLSLYADALQIFLSQALQVEAEGEWWGDIERSQAALIRYLIQTLPCRLMNLSKTILSILRTELQARHESFSLSNLSPARLHELLQPTFSTTGFSLRPGTILTTLFPHLENQNEQQTLSLTVLFASPTPFNPIEPSAPAPSIPLWFSRVRITLRRFVVGVERLVFLPLELTRQECKQKRKALEMIRDERASTLGDLALMRTNLSSISCATKLGLEAHTKQYTTFLNALVHVVSPDTTEGYVDPDPLSLITRLSAAYLPPLHPMHTWTLETTRLLRPSRLTLMWPHLLLLPPLSLYIYTSRSAWIPKLIEAANDAGETIRGFVEGWLVQPLRDTLRTVRAGSAGGDVKGRIVTEEGVTSDLESLQRMSRSLASDFLDYTPNQLRELATQVERGDMTPIMELYEEDMRNPIKGVVRGGGRLIRGVLVQVQKAKVDIDYALRGIDHLLKSQELTFAFVGLSPAMLIVYLLSGALRGLWRGGRIGGRHGGRKRRRVAWEGIRRIEKLLILQPCTSTGPAPKSFSTTQDRALSPLPTGLLLLSLLRLRAWGNQYLPLRIRGPFLEDLEMLEDPRLDRDGKLLVIERVWRIWKGVEC